MAFSGNETSLNLNLNQFTGVWNDDTDNFAEHVFGICNNYNNRYVSEDEVHDFFHLNSFATFKLLHINCRSIGKNFTAIENLLTACHPLTALAVTETWLSNATQDIHKIPGYSFISSVRDDRKAGGVGIYLNDNLNFFRRTDISFMACYMECLFIEIPQTNKPSILIGCVYRPPDAEVALFNSKMIAVLSTLNAKKRKYCFYIGRFQSGFVKLSKQCSN